MIHATIGRGRTTSSCGKLLGLTGFNGETKSQKVVADKVAAEKAERFVLAVRKALKEIEATIDHTIPKSKGGIGPYKQLTAAHRECNHKKADSYDGPAIPLVRR